MQTCGNPHTLQRLFLDKPLADELQHGHVLIGPFNSPLACIGQRQILHITKLLCNRFQRKPQEFFCTRFLFRMSIGEVVAIPRTLHRELPNDALRPPRVCLTHLLSNQFDFIVFSQEKLDSVRPKWP